MDLRYYFYVQKIKFYDHLSDCCCCCKKCRKARVKVGNVKECEKGKEKG